MATGSFKAGTQVWCEAEGAEPYLRGIVRTDPTPDDEPSCDVQLSTQVPLVQHKLQKLHLRSEPDTPNASPRLCHDNVALTHLNEPSILGVQSLPKLEGAESGTCRVNSRLGGMVLESAHADSIGSRESACRGESLSTDGS